MRLCLPEQDISRVKSVLSSFTAFWARAISLRCSTWLVFGYNYPNERCLYTYLAVDREFLRYFVIEAVRVMAGKDSEGMSPVDESLQHVEESPDINHNPESREKDKPLKKKAEVSRAKREKASQPSSSKTTSVVKSDFIESIKALISH